MTQLGYFYSFLLESSYSYQSWFNRTESKQLVKLKRQNLYNPLRLWVCFVFPAVSSSYRWIVATQSIGHTMSWDPSSVFIKFFGTTCRSCAAQKLFVTLYTKEHTKSMKPHCILGSCSAQFLSIMGWERESEKSFRWNYNPEKPRVNHAKWREGTRGVRPLQLVVGPKHFSPSLLVPRIRQRPSEPPGEEQIDKDQYRDISDKHREEKASEWVAFFTFSFILCYFQPSVFTCTWNGQGYLWRCTKLLALLWLFVRFAPVYFWIPCEFHYIFCNLPTWRLWRPPTLLCTSQGLVIADKSQPVIIMAL